MKHNIDMKTKNILKNLFFFIIPFLILLTISLVLMYHAKFIMELYEKHFEKQFTWIIIGIIAGIFLYFLPTKKLLKWSVFLYLGNILLLILVLTIGENVNGAKAWLNFKYFSVQPSELMKLTYSLFLTYLISKKKFKNWKQELLFLLEILIIFLIPAILIFLEPDTGAIIFLGLITIILLWNSNLRKRWFMILGIILLSVIGGFFYCYFYQKDFLIKLIGTTFFYRMERLFMFQNGMQIENALIAIGSAPLYRFNLTTTGIYIPESPTDFAFALSSNVFGLAGNITILVCFLILDWYFLSFYKKRKEKEEKLFLLTFLSIFIPSQIINISMNLGIFPIIGIPLPFISYGGSSTIVLFLYLGLIFSFRKQKKKRKN